MPNYHKYATQMSVENYVKAVVRNEIFHSVLTFQKQIGFTFKKSLQIIY